MANVINHDVTGLFWSHWIVLFCSYNILEFIPQFWREQSMYQTITKSDYLEVGQRHSFTNTSPLDSNGRHDGRVHEEIGFTDWLGLVESLNQSELICIHNLQV